jgi:ABC-type nitrate/sulfonate/bicarbonate transport system substrate-binding protein
MHGSDPRRRLARRDFLQLSAGVTVSMLAAGCAGGPSGAPAPSSAGQASAPAAREVVRWRHGDVSPLFETAFRYMAHEKGFDHEEGLDVEIAHIASGTTILKGVLAGEYDTAELGTAPIYPAVAQGAPVKLLASFMPGQFYYFYVRRDIQDLPDLYGRSIGSGEPGALLHQLAVALFLSRGLDPSRVEFVNVGGSPAVYRAVVSGKVDAGVAGAEFYRDAERNPEVKPLLVMHEALPRYLRFGLIASDRVIRERPEQLTAFLRAWTRGHRYALEHKAETVALAAKITGLDNLDDLNWTFDWYVRNQVVDPNGRLPPESLQYMQELSVATGAQATIVPEERLVDRRFMEQVLAQLGPYQSPPS